MTVPMIHMPGCPKVSDPSADCNCSPRQIFPESAMDKSLRNARMVREASPDPTLPDGQTDDPERYRIMRLCPCPDCNTTGHAPDGGRCKTCRGEGRQLQELATCGNKEAVGVALITLAGEGEFEDDCQFGLIDRAGAKGKKWLVLPFRPSPRNVSDAGRVLAHARHQQ